MPTATSAVVNAPPGQESHNVHPWGWEAVIEILSINPLQKAL